MIAEFATLGHDPRQAVGAAVEQLEVLQSRLASGSMRPRLWLSRGLAPNGFRYVVAGSAIPMGSTLSGFCGTSKRSAFITLVQAFTKSRTNFSSCPFSA